MKLYAAFALALAAVVVAAGCSVPHSVVKGQSNNGLFALIVQPADAQVVVDGNLIGKASAYNGKHGYLEIASGTHRLEIRRDGYQPFVRDVYSSNAVQEIHVTLTPLPK